MEGFENEVLKKINVSHKTNKKQTPWPLVRERTIPTERPPLVDEIVSHEVKKYRCDKSTE
jgi:hypothetical protein